LPKSSRVTKLTLQLFGDRTLVDPLCQGTHKMTL
jgi:hypothetical protein